MKKMLAAAGAVVLGLASGANATPIYLATGTLTGSTAGSYADLSGLTGTLENGQAANLLGGLGSGLAYAGGSTFIAIPDRGPNAVPYASAVDDTTSFISRFQTLNLALTPSAPGSALPFTLTPSLTSTTLLYSPTSLYYGAGGQLENDMKTVLPSGVPTTNSAGKYYFTGRSDGYNPATNSGDPADARFDPESVRVSPDGKFVFISDEYGPYIREFDRSTGALVKTFTLPGNLDISNLSPNGATEISGNTTGRVANKGMEGLALTPDGKTLVGIMQASLEQDAPLNSNLLRIVTVDVATGTTHEYAYYLTKGSGVSEIVALNNHQFLVDERDGKGLGDGSSAKVKQLYIIDTNGAADLLDTKTNPDPTKATPVTKSATPFLDLVTALTAAGVKATDIPSKIEGVALGQDVTMNGTNYHTVYIANDNDFVSDTSGPNRFYVFGFTDADLAAFGVTLAVPEPSTWGMMVGGLGAMGAMLRRRRKAVLTLA